jgi:phosphoenolpyruvate carboxylase
MQNPNNAQSENGESQGAALRADVRRLGELLGQTLVRQEGQQLLDLVESVRLAVREDSPLGASILEKVDVSESIKLVRAFSTYFHLANIAEQSTAHGHFLQSE